MMQNTNKDGQSIGRKGAESRARLLAAARGMIASAPAEKLTASAIARQAGLASQSFYVYFDGIDEVLLRLATEASEDTAEIIAELDRPWDLAALHAHAERIVGAFYRYWDRHRAILTIRNFRADSGSEDFGRIRNESALPLVLKIAARIRAAQGEQLPTARAATARAIIIFAAIERMAARYASGQTDNSMVGAEDLKRAEVDILAMLISPSA